MKSKYSLYVSETNISGSGKATSYIRALDLLSEMLIVKSFGFDDCIDIWNITSLQRIAQLKELVTVEQRKRDNSEWLSSGIAPSYLINGYCKAALSSYAKFIAESNQENNLFDTFNAHEGDGDELSGLLNTEPDNVDVLIDGLKQAEGGDVIRSVKTRLNQNVFRRMLMDIYNQSCCITGLNIPQVNRASHIISWADDSSKRLDPSNGLYLSATYDAAFDKNLISLDDDYRIILASDIKDHFTHASVTEYFVKKEGQVINLPYKYLPNKAYLAQHREKSDF
jgi:putative restriction endonuclease